MTVLVAVISGKRPLLRQRPTAKILPGLPWHCVWFVREDQANEYEPDGNEIHAYDTDWASEYARAHWRHPKAEWEHGGFHGAFTGREAAMRYAEEHGYGYVVQLDDNISEMGYRDSNRQRLRALADPATCLLHLTLLAQSTNAHMVGAQLNASAPDKIRLLRNGFPYSCFTEKTANRQPWYGPFEDDIMHAMEYGLHGGPQRTVAITDAIRYTKPGVASKRDGMRGHYDNSRGLELPRRYPDNARLTVTRRTLSNSDKAKGVRHILKTTGFTPVRVTDRTIYDATISEMKRILDECQTEMRRVNQDKIRRRAHGRRT